MAKRKKRRKQSKLTVEDYYYFDHPEELLDWQGKRVGPRQRRLLRLYEKQNGQCFYCGEFMELDWKYPRWNRSRELKRQIASIEHLVPASQNGRTNNKNIVAACQFCNGTRATNPVEHFQKELAKYGKDELVHNLNIRQDYRGALKTVRFRATTSYALFWMNIIFHPEYWKDLKRLPIPNQISKTLETELEKFNIKTLNAVMRMFDLESTKDYDPVTRQHV